MAACGSTGSIATTPRELDRIAWTEEELRRFLASSSEHRWSGPIRLAALYGLRRSELLGLSWSSVDLSKRTVRIERGLIEVHGRPEWSDGKNASARRTIPIDKPVAAALKAHRSVQAEERLIAGRDWHGEDLVIATRNGRQVSPGNFDQTLERLVRQADVPRLTSHGLRHTAATHMVRHASDLGEIRAAADILGHSPDMLMRTYAHVMPGGRQFGRDAICRSELSGTQRRGWSTWRRWRWRTPFRSRSRQTLPGTNSTSR